MKAHEVIARTVRQDVWETEPNPEVEALCEDIRADARREADMILAALDAAGFIIAPKEPETDFLKTNNDPPRK
jgi:hypothetical protein